MSININWVDENKEIILIKYEKRWTWTEFQEAVDTTNAMINAVNHPVVEIHDTLEGAVLPQGNIIAQGKQAFAGAADNVSLIIVVVNSSIIQTFLSLVAKFIPNGRGHIIKTVSTMEEANRLSQEVHSNPS